MVETTKFGGRVIDYRHKEGSPAYFYSVEDKDSNVCDVSSYKHDTGARRNDVVSFDYKVSGDYKNLVGEMIIVSKAEGNTNEVVEEKIGESKTMTTIDNRSETIIRQVCLKIAAEILNKHSDGMPLPADLVMYSKDLYEEFTK